MQTYVERLGRDAQGMDGKEDRARAWNPRFVLRQWVLEEIIEKVQLREENARIELNKILKVGSFFFSLLLNLSSTTTDELASSSSDGDESIPGVGQGGRAVGWGAHGRRARGASSVWARTGEDARLSVLVLFLALLHALSLHSSRALRE